MNNLLKLMLVAVLSAFVAIPVMAKEGVGPSAEVGVGDPAMKPVPETTPVPPAATKTPTKRGVWVKNFTKKTLTMTAQRPGMEDLDLGLLVPGMEVFLPNAKGTVVSLTFKGGWFFKRELQQRFTEGTTVEEHSLAVRD